MSEVEVPEFGFEMISQEKLQTIENLLRQKPDWGTWTTILWQHPLVTASLRITRSGVRKSAELVLEPFLGSKDWIAVPVGSIVWGLAANEHTNRFSDLDLVLITSNPEIPDLLTKKKPQLGNLDVVKTVLIKDDHLAEVQSAYNYDGVENVTRFYNLRYKYGDFGARSIISSLVTPDTLIAGDMNYLPELRRAFFENRFIKSPEGRLQTLFAIRGYIGRYYLSWRDVSLIEDPSNGRIELEKKRANRFEELVSVCASLNPISEEGLFEWMELIYGYNGLLAQNIPEVPDIARFFAGNRYTLRV